MSARRLWPLAGTIVMTLGSILVTSCAQKPSGGVAAEWEAPARADAILNPVAAGHDSIAAGKAMYKQDCRACHGNLGKGNGPAAIALDPRPADLSMPMMWEHSDGALFWKVTQGRRPMPSFEKRFSENERWQIVAYIRTLATRPKSSALSKETKATTRRMAPMGDMH